MCMNVYCMRVRVNLNELQSFLVSLGHRHHRGIAQSLSGRLRPQTANSNAKLTHERKKEGKGYLSSLTNNYFLDVCQVSSTRSSRRRMERQRNANIGRENKGGPKR